MQISKELKKKKVHRSSQFVLERISKDGKSGKFYLGGGRIGSDLMKDCRTEVKVEGAQSSIRGEKLLHFHELDHNDAWTTFLKIVGGETEGERIFWFDPLRIIHVNVYTFYWQWQSDIWSFMDIANKANCLVTCQGWFARMC